MCREKQLPAFQDQTTLKNGKNLGFIKRNRVSHWTLQGNFSWYKSELGANYEAGKHGGVGLSVQTPSEDRVSSENEGGGKVVDSTQINAVVLWRWLSRARNIWGSMAVLGLRETFQATNASGKKGRATRKLDRNTRKSLCQKQQSGGY